MAKKIGSAEGKRGLRRYRDDATGRFVTRKSAKKNKKTTTKEPVAQA